MRLSSVIALAAFALLASASPINGYTQMSKTVRKRAEDKQAQHGKSDNQPNQQYPIGTANGNLHGWLGHYDPSKPSDQLCVWSENGCSAHHHEKLAPLSAGGQGSNEGTGNKAIKDAEAEKPKRKPSQKESHRRR